MKRKIKNEIEMIDEFISRFDEINTLRLRITLISGLVNERNPFPLLTAKIFTYCLGIIVALIKIQSVLLKSLVIFVLAIILIFLIDDLVLRIDYLLCKDKFETDLSLDRKRLDAIMDRFRAITETEGFPPLGRYTVYNLEIIRDSMLINGVDLAKAIELEKEYLIYG
ncbi:MAG: hypothetical protein IJI66_01790 [Erysipelotrichaceae bacterium]|nr:hypothetical protein [Erysipelotrichaceae bacterium]